MNPALKPILAAIESAVVRIEYARDDEHAQREAEELLDNARTLLGILNESVPAFTEADPVPVRRNCWTCALAPNRPSDCDYPPGGPLFNKIVDWTGDNTLTSGDPKPDADNCPGYTLRVSVTVVDDGPDLHPLNFDYVSELARRCGLVLDNEGDEDEWAYFAEDTGAVRIAHTSWWDRERDKKREPGWAIFEDWRLFATIEDAVRAYAADHTLPRVGARITAKSP